MKQASTRLLATIDRLNAQTMSLLSPGVGVRACNEGYPKVPEDFTITEKAPLGLLWPFFGLKHSLALSQVDVKLGPRWNYHKEWARLAWCLNIVS